MIIYFSDIFVRDGNGALSAKNGEIWRMMAKIGKEVCCRGKGNLREGRRQQLNWKLNFGPSSILGGGKQN
jgi:hypothetical protein